MICRTCRKFLNESGLPNAPSSSARNQRTAVSPPKTIERSKFLFSAYGGNCKTVVDSGRASLRVPAGSNADARDARPYQNGL